MPRGTEPLRDTSPQKRQVHAIAPILPNVTELVRQSVHHQETQATDQSLFHRVFSAMQCRFDHRERIERGAGIFVTQAQDLPIGRDTEPKIEATLTERLDGSRWRALVRPAKKLAARDIVRFGEAGKVCHPSPAGRKRRAELANPRQYCSGRSGRL